MCSINEKEETTAIDQNKKWSTIINFTFMSFLYSTCHSTAVSCVELAVAQLGEVGEIQSGTLYLSYTGSALFFASPVVKILGPRNALMVSMLIYSIYILCYLVAATFDGIALVSAVTGAAIGGLGAGLLSTAQGSYFAYSSEIYAEACHIDIENATSIFGSIFASIYLTMEIILKLISSALIEYGFSSWSQVYSLYLALSIISALLMIFVQDFEKEIKEAEKKDGSLDKGLVSKCLIPLKLFIEDPKMKYMIGLTSIFGFSSTFLISYVSGTIEPEIMNDNESAYIGVLFSIASAVAAFSSAIFGLFAQRTGKGFILALGSFSFFLIGLLFIIIPNPKHWNQAMLVSLFIFHGIGRATFESTLRASFADMFSQNKEGAYANIVIQNGFITAILFFFSWCISPLTHEILLMCSALVSILGYQSAHKMYLEEKLKILVDENEVIS